MIVRARQHEAFGRAPTQVGAAVRYLLMNPTTSCTVAWGFSSMIQ
jgi:hypothetical protein